MGLKSTGGGEIVQVQGGHIIRATGRKDRHSKVFTAKGPRDRRVRLAAHTAIQFYDVQDRLGYDRPSKAVDWLINKAKASIDKLAELPPWDPTVVAAGSHHVGVGVVDANNENNVGSSNQISLGGDYHNNNNNTNNNNNDNNNTTTSQFYNVPQCVDSQSLADSIKSFFPTNNNTNNSLSFQNYPHDQFISRGSNHHHHHQNTQDLCLSLHTLQDPAAPSGSAHQPDSHAHALFHGSGFDGGWGQHQDIGRFTRLMGWAGENGGGGGGGGGGDGNRGGLIFNSPPQLSAQALLLSQHQQQEGGAGSTTATFSHHHHQRGTLQSSYSPLARAFEENHNHSHNHSDSGIGHGSDTFMGFYIPSQIHGDLHAAAAASMSNTRASSSSLSPDSSQH